MKNKRNPRLFVGYTFFSVRSVIFYKINHKIYQKCEILKKIQVVIFVFSLELVQRETCR